MMTFTNQATLTYSGGTTNSNITVGQLLATLSVTKTAVSTVYGAGDDVTYVISLVNSGTTAFTGLTLTDNLGAYTFADATLYPLTYTDGSIRYYVNGVLQAAPAVVAGPPLQFAGISVPAGGTATLIYEADVNQFAPLGETDEITNTVTVTGNGILNPLTASETVTPTIDPNLTVTKSMSPTAVAENGQLTYTFAIQNTGNAAAVGTDNVVLTDTFNPALSNLTVTLNGTLLNAGTDYTYDEATGVFSTVAGRITVPAATFTQNPITGAWTITPGLSTLVVTGTV